MLTDKETKALQTETVEDGSIDAGREDADNLRSTLYSAAAQSQSHADADEDLESARPLLDELESRFPGRSAPEIVGSFLNMDTDVRAEPSFGGDKVAEFYARFRPPYAIGSSQSPAPQLRDDEAAVKLPNGKTIVANKGSVAHTAALAMRDSMTNTAQRGSLKDLQRLMAQLHPGVPFSAALRKVLDFDKAASVDPIKEGQRLAATYGAPMTAEQARTYNPHGNIKAVTDDLLATQYRHLAPRRGEISQLIADGTLYGPGDKAGPAEILARADQYFALQNQCAAEIAEFKARAPRFDKVRHKMSALLDRGEANSLEDAYQKVTGERARKPAERTLRDDLQNTLRGQRR